MKSVFTLFTLLLTFGLFAQLENTVYEGTLPTDRPGQTYNARTLQAGVWQLQAAGDVGGLFTARGLSYDVFAIPIDLRYGITEKLEIMFSPKFSFASTQGTGAGIEYSLTDLQGTLRYNLVDGAPYGSIGFFAGYKHSIYEGGIANANQGIFKVLYALPLGERLGFSSNLGYSVTSQTGTDGMQSTANLFDYTANFAFNFSDAFGMFVEAFGSVDLGDGDGSNSWVDAGVFWLLSPDFQFDLAFGNSNTTGDYYTSLGISYRFGNPR